MDPSEDSSSSASQDSVEEMLVVVLSAYESRQKQPMYRQPCRTSEHTGQVWVYEVLNGHPKRCHEMFRMDKDLFMRLCDELMGHSLRNTRLMNVEEMVAIFLCTVSQCMSNRHLQERFQHSGETISRHFHRVLKACRYLACEYIRPQDPEFRTPHHHIYFDDRYYPFFNDAIGAIDGTHIRCFPPKDDYSKYISRKGYPSQNVMAVCDWDMCFTFVLAGWEGAAHDSRIFNEALTNQQHNFPHPPKGKYYLVDAGYPVMQGYIGPYKTERYHLPDFRKDRQFANDNETFNYYHSSLRSAIERTFGVWKKKFPILLNMPQFQYEHQVGIVIATAGLHNFIRRNGSTNDDSDSDDPENIDVENGDTDLGQVSQQPHGATQAKQLRDSIRDHIVAHIKARNQRR